MEVPMIAAARHLPPRPKPLPNAPEMIAFADRDHVTEVVTAAVWAPPRFEDLDMDLDIAAGLTIATCPTLRFRFVPHPPPPPVKNLGAEIAIVGEPIRSDDRDRGMVPNARHGLRSVKISAGGPRR
jgi:hypothetical protein